MRNSIATEIAAWPSAAISLPTEQPLPIIADTSAGVL